jgi:hypothetical protein
MPEARNRATVAGDAIPEDLESKRRVGRRFLLRELDQDAGKGLADAFAVFR